MGKNQRFIFCAGGIFVSYFYFGILQEKITRGNYPYTSVDESGLVKNINEKFTFALSLVFIQCLINYLFAKGMLIAKPQPEDTTPTKYFASASLTYLLAMICSNMALQWVPYPTQVVGKSAKPIPVMILGVLIGRKSYALRKYLFVLLIVIGVVLFMYKDKSGKVQTGGSSIGIGELLLILSLVMDGLTGAVQERMRAESKPSAQQMMMAMNFWSTVFVTFTLLLTGETFEFFNFVTRHPSVILNMSLLAVTGALGQLFIFLMVSEFGPLPCSVVTTTRKFFTVLASVLIFQNPLLPRQWIGAVIVFTGLFLDAYYSKSTPKKK
ncbi:solute carrier family 35 member B1 homolog [Onthophagus taurus]|uniref:solute carrier family 35 member B1 homolog n=1 Tax=Onthophagus taurus TaxID=166361 RepID=UPI0039BECB34